jgi:hypothetical protein
MRDWDGFWTYISSALSARDITGGEGADNTDVSREGVGEDCEHCIKVLSGITALSFFPFDSFVVLAFFLLLAVFLSISAGASSSVVTESRLCLRFFSLFLTCGVWKCIAVNSNGYVGASKM